MAMHEREHGTAGLGEPAFRLLPEQAEIVAERVRHATGVATRVIDLFREFQQIVFLGFGFDQQNINILGLNTGTPEKIVAVTKVGLTPVEWTLARGRLGTTTVSYHSDTRGEPDWDCLGLLRNVPLW